MLQIYGLSDSSIISLLEQKKREGVSVTVFHDKNGAKSLPPSLGAYPVKTTGLMHRKILIIDEAQVFLGTANFTTQSLKMHDNLVLGAWSPSLAKFLQDSIDTEDSVEVGGVNITSFLLPDFEGRAIKQLAERIDSASKTIRMAMFTLTHPELVHKLTEAQKRGVAVSIAIDRYTAQGASQKSIEILQKAGAEILTNRGSQLLHHKWALIDEKTLIMGSANWTDAAFSKNQDCLLILEELPKEQQKVLKKIWKAVAIASEKL